MNEELAKNQLRFAVSNIVTRAKKRDLEVAAKERVDYEKKMKVGAARAAKRAVTGAARSRRVSLSVTISAVRMCRERWYCVFSRACLYRSGGS